MDILRLKGSEIGASWRELADLRLQVFREYPYLYEGTLAYEQEYLANYWRSAGSLAVLVRDQGRAVGVSTSMPLNDEHAEFKAPFQKPKEFYYLGESVLLPAYRGRGLGNLFFDEREARARELGFKNVCFCAVERPEGHPLRPPDYRSLHGFWEKRGYQRQPQLRTEYSWKDLGEAQDTPKRMVFWTRQL